MIKKFDEFINENNSEVYTLYIKFDEYNPKNKVNRAKLVEIFLKKAFGRAEHFMRTLWAPGDKPRGKGENAGDLNVLHHTCHGFFHKQGAFLKACVKIALFLMGDIDNRYKQCICREKHGAEPDGIVIHKDVHYRIEAEEYGTAEQAYPQKHIVFREDTAIVFLTHWILFSFDLFVDY